MGGSYNSHLVHSGCSHFTALPASAFPPILLLFYSLPSIQCRWILIDREMTVHMFDMRRYVQSLHIQAIT